MLRDKAGNRLYRKVDIKIVFPDNILPVRRLISRAGPKQGFTPEGIDELLMKTADQLDELYPWWNFKMQELASQGRTACYVFAFAGYREIPATVPVEVPQ